MASGAYDGLFGKPTWGGTGRPWLEVLTPEARASVDELVDKVVECGSPSSWSQAHRIFCEKFPDLATTQTTFKKTVVDLVRSRG